jgi:hypothetical protein
MDGMALVAVGVPSAALPSIQSIPTCSLPVDSANSGPPIQVGQYRDVSTVIAVWVVCRQSSSRVRPAVRCWSRPGEREDFVSSSRHRP